MPGYHDHRQIGVDGDHMVEQLQAIHAFHPHVGDDHRRQMRVQMWTQRICRIEGLHGKSGQFQRLRRTKANGRVILHQDDPDVFAHALLRHGRRSPDRLQWSRLRRSAARR